MFPQILIKHADFQIDDKHVTHDAVTINTNNEIGTELKKSQEKAKSQDELILIYFRNHDQLGVTPERVLRHFRIMEPLSSDRWANTPITSIRRSFSNLHKRGLIEKAGYKIEGDFGKQINVWRCK
jgi:hypothetical protein